uniref:Uncharacterized protein n=1 Tax=Octopus bimaculoides TaxID=37653 RepID=A0A0L8GMD3_OCTBM
MLQTCRPEDVKIFIFILVPVLGGPARQHICYFGHFHKNIKRFFNNLPAILQTGTT